MSGVKKRRVYFNEYNVPQANNAYLPLVSGLLQAYAETHPKIKAQYEFMPFLFIRESVEEIVDKYEHPSVAAFAISMWNEQANLKVAAKIKQLYPHCLVVFGGPHVPHYPKDYFERYPFIDVAVRGEGEEAFSEVLTRFIDFRSFDGIPGISWRDPQSQALVRNDEERELPRDLDVFPSPYLNGLYDSLFVGNPNANYQAIIETNRGCPFLCTFCFWGQGGLNLKFRFHSKERVREELKWMAKHKIQYLFNADSNFGMHRQDMDTAKTLVEMKKKYGYPDKFRTCFGKNTDNRIYDVATLLHQNDLEKGITLSRQSNNPETLDNIKRKNIKMSTYRNLQTMFNENGIPVYTELIMGLPGETHDTWIKGIEELLQSGLKNQIFVYLCQIFPNTEMDSPENIQKFGIKTQRIVLNEIHGKIRPQQITPEFEDIIITTDTMPLRDWRKVTRLSWVTMTLHSLKLGFFVMMYLWDRFKIPYTEFIQYISELQMPGQIGAILRQEIGEFDAQLDRILEGYGRGRIMPEYGDIYWDEEEASYLRISEKLDLFYAELHEVVTAFLRVKEIGYDSDELAEVIQYQQLRIPTLHPSRVTVYGFKYNISEYFETRFRFKEIPICVKPQILRIYPEDYNGKRSRYARKTILWGRKSGTMLTNVKWQDDDIQMPAVVNS